MFYVHHPLLLQRASAITCSNILDHTAVYLLYIFNLNTSILYCFLRDTALFTWEFLECWNFIWYYNTHSNIYDFLNLSFVFTFLFPALSNLFRSRVWTLEHVVDTRRKTWSTSALSYNQVCRDICQDSIGSFQSCRSGSKMVILCLPCDYSCIFLQESRIKAAIDIVLEKA